MSAKLTILGCGHSGGTPMIGNHWGNCDPDEPKNYRTRASALVHNDNTTLVIDTGPDFKEQINRMNIDYHLDGVLYTHAHSDHILGIDDLRVLRNRYKKYVPVYGNKATLDEIKMRFDYLFEQRAEIYPKVVDPFVFDKSHFGQSYTIGDINFTPFEQMHGQMISLGYRFGDVAYSTDVSNLDDRAFNALKGVKTWVIDGAGYKFQWDENFVHLSLGKIYEFNKTIQAEKVYITHLTPQMDYATLMKELPEGYELAYDGLEITI